MNKKQAIFMGVAGAAVAAAVIGGSFLGSQPTNPSEKTAPSEMEQYKEQIRILDEEKQKLLNSIVFYQGNATIQETYNAVSGVEGDKPVIGSAAMVSEDIFVYDERTRKSCLIARRISLLGDSVKAFEYLDIYKGTATVKVGGILTEYYGNGVLQAYDVIDALEGKKGYYLSFESNPVRIDCDAELIYTNPPVKKTYWIQVIGSDGVDMVATGVFTPEELPYVEVGLMPGLTNLVGEKTYNSSQTMIYDYTGGQISPQGKFFFDYKKVTYDEIKDFLDELKTEAQKDKQLEEAAETLSEAWKDALAAEQEIKTVIDASVNIKNHTDIFSGSNNADASANKNQVDMLAGSTDFSGEIQRAENAVDSLESSDGSLRKLEDFSLGGGGGEGDRQEAADAIGDLLPVFKEFLSLYRTEISELKGNTVNLRSVLIGKSQLDRDSGILLDKIRKGAAEISRLSTCLSQLSSHFYSVLLGYDYGVNPDETEFAALTRLCGLWRTALAGCVSGETTSPEMPAGAMVAADYPSGIVPLIKNAEIFACEKDEDGVISVTLLTTMAVEDAVEYYRNALSEAEDFSDFSMGGTWTLTGIKENFEVSVLVSPNQLGGSEPTMVQINLIPAE